MHQVGTIYERAASLNSDIEARYISYIAAKANTQQYVQTGYKYDDGDVFLEYFAGSFVEPAGNETELTLHYAFPNETRLWYIDPGHSQNAPFSNSQGVKDIWFEKKGTGEKYYLMRNRAWVNGAYVDPNTANGLYNGYTDPVSGRNIFQRTLWEGNASGYLNMHVVMDSPQGVRPIFCGLGYKPKIPVYGWANR